MKRFWLCFLLCMLMLNAPLAYGVDEERRTIPIFDINGFKIEGNTLLEKTDIDAVLAPFTGRQKDFNTVQESIEALKRAYFNRGFSTVQVVLPEQDIKDGVIRLVVMETIISSVTIEGNKYFDEKNIRRSIPALREGSAPNLNKISSSLKAANENPAKKVLIQLAESDKEKEVKAVLKVADEKPWKVTLMADNTGTRDTGEARTGVLLQYMNVANLDHIVSLQYTTSPEKIDKVTILGLGYHIPIYTFGDSLDLYAGYSDVDSGTIYAGTTDISVSGSGAAFGARYNQNFRRFGGYEHKLTYGLDYRKYRSNATLLSTIDMDTDIVVHPLSLAYSGIFRFAAGQAGMNLSLTRNIPGGDNGSDDDFKQARSGAPAAYTIFRYGAHFVYALPLDLQVRLLFNGQFTNDPLVPGEQFGLGGANSVRGFQEREVSDDIGNSGSIEFYSPDIFNLMNIHNFRGRMLVFYDAGQVSRVSPLPGEESYTAVSSAGAGVRLGWGKNFNLTADYGYALGVEGTRAVRNNRFHLTAAFSF